MARALKNTREDTTIYPASVYRGLTSNSEWFFVFKSTEIGGYNKGERKFGKGSLGAVLWLVDGEVCSPASKGNVPLSSWVAGGRNTLLFLLVALFSRQSPLLNLLANEEERGEVPLYGGDLPLIF